MSEPQQPSVPPYGQPSPQPQAAPQPPAAQPYPPQQPTAQPQQPTAQPYPPQQQPSPLDGALHGYPPSGAPYSPAAQQYAAAGYPAYAPKPAASGQALGRTALIVALITFGIGLVATFLFPILYSTLGYSYGLSYGVFNGVTSFLVLVGSAIALVLGLIAIRRPGSPVLAGIAIGIAASEIAGTLISWISSLFYTFV